MGGVSTTHANWLIRRRSPIGLLTALILLSAHAAWGAMPELVGLGALALETDVADRLALSDEQREALTQLAIRRENAGEALVLRASLLPPDQQDTLLKPFRTESGRLALDILSDAQRETLSQIQQERNNPLYDSVEEVQQAQPPPRGGRGGPAGRPRQRSGDGGRFSRGGPDRPNRRSERAGDTQSPTEGEPAQPAARGEQQFLADTRDQAERDGAITFNFRYQPWEDVLEWFAERADLSLILDAPPPGTFNYRDNREYDVAGAMDVLNNVLQTKGYTLVRKGRLLLVVNLEDEIPPNLVTDVPLEQLDEHGEHELVRVLFRIRGMLPEEAAEELQQLTGPQGKIVVLSKAGMIQVTETVGRIRAIQRVIEAIDAPAKGDIREFELQNVLVGEVLPVIRQMLGIPEDALSTPAGTLQLAFDPLGGKIFARGESDQLEQVDDILEMVDVPGAAAGGVAEPPQLEVYSTGGVDGQLVLQVLQTILADTPGLRLAADDATGNLVALARPSQHATIRATLQQMQQDARKVEVIPLGRLDPTLAVMSVNKLFNPGTADAPDPRAPIVDADVSSGSLMVRATPAQIEEIKQLLTELGKSGASEFAMGERGNVRLIPMTGASARSAVSQVEKIWPTMRSNQIRVVTPSASIPEYRPAAPERGPIDRDQAPGAGFNGADGYRGWMGESLEPLPQQERPTPPANEPAPAEDSSAATDARVPARFVSQPTDPPSEPADGPPAEPDESAIPNNPGAQITVMIGPGGVLLVSEDLEALDQFESLLRTAVGQTTSGRQFAVFYLRYAEAGTASEILSGIFGASSGGMGLAEGIADAALGGMGGGLMGDLLGLGGGGGDSSSGFSSTSLQVVPVVRLNALFVYGNPRDLDTVEQLLRIIDQRTGPETVEAGGRPRLIPVYNRAASGVADTIKQIYQDRIQGAGGAGNGGGGGRQPSPEDFIRALRGRGGGGGGDDGVPQEPPKMSIGVDTRSNSVVVRAPDVLFNEVERLVELLDQEGAETPKETRIIALEHTNAQAMKATLDSLLGAESVQSSITTAEEAAEGGEQNARQGGNNEDAEAAARAARARLEFFRRMQQQGGFGGRGGGPFGGGDRGGGDRGGGDRGGGRGR